MNRIRKQILLLVLAAAGFELEAADPTVRLITLDPGHFHAGLVQKFMYPQVSGDVRIYSPGGPELQEHLARIEGYNNRADQPTRWNSIVYTGSDFLDRMIADRAGNVVVISGNNLRKTEYIQRSIGAGLNVLADKPMAITPADFKQLRKAFKEADKNRVLLYDIMTERFEITSILQRELARNALVFGELEPGSPVSPAVIMDSVHYYSKEVSGKPLIRPAWFFDIRQQGEAIPDIGTHLVDLVQWECFPDQTLDWTRDVKPLFAHRWPTRLSPAQFMKVTGLAQFPPCLANEVGSDGNLRVFQNGDVTFSIRGIYARVTAIWNFSPPPGAKDSHYSLLRGTGADLVIRQGIDQAYAPTLYVEPRGNRADFEPRLRKSIQDLSATWPGLDMAPTADGWRILIPEKYSVGHEAHFAQVTENFLKYAAEGKLPAWEVPNMICKYYITTEAYRLAREQR